jgi:anti-sigma factor RsiW
VYVLGAIDPAERSQVEAHLSMCPSCRDELAGMAGLPALLSRVSEPQIAHVAGPPEELLDSLLAKAADQRQSEREQLRRQAEQTQVERAERERIELRTRRASRRRRWPRIAVAAGIVMLAGMLLGGLVTGGGGGRPVSPVPHSSFTAPQPPAAPVVDQVTRTDPRTQVRARIGLDKKQWGTALTVRIDGAPPGARCHLYAIGRNGSRDIAAGWQIEAEGYGDFFGSTMIPRDQLTSLEVVTTDGRTLVTVPVST